MTRRIIATINVSVKYGMGYPDHQLWALAVGAPVMALEQLDVRLLGGRGHDDPLARDACRETLKTLYGVDSRATLERTLIGLLKEGHSASARAILAELGDDASSDDARHALVRANREAIARAGLMAWDAARAVAVTGWGFWAGFFPEPEAWQIIMVAAARVQKAYGSWEAFADGYELGRLFSCDGAADEPTARALAKLRSDRDGPWRALRWDFDLGVVLVDIAKANARFKRSTCARCGAPKSRPSATAYVYCDYCGSLCDFDFAKACERPLERPGPVYVALLEQLAPALRAARERDDVEGYRALQAQLFEKYVEACPGSVSLRVGDPSYRAKYVAWMADGATARAFDARSTELAAEVAKVSQRLAFVEARPGVPRVAPDVWEALLDAVLAQQAHDRELLDMRGVSARHPDGASSELQLRVSLSMFAQGWLPMLDEEHARELLARVGLQGEYVEAEASPPRDARASTCGACGAPALVLAGAKRVICEHCGHALDVASESIRCAGCGASVATPEGVTTFSCPHCRVMLERVAVMTPA